MRTIKLVHVVTIIDIVGTANIFYDFKARADRDYLRRVLHLVGKFLHVSVIQNGHTIIVPSACFFFDRCAKIQQTLTDGINRSVIF